MYVGNTGTTGMACSGCTVVTSISAFPAAVEQVYTWGAVSGAWDTTGTDLRASYGGNGVPDVVCDATCIASRLANGNVSLSVVGGGGGGSVLFERAMRVKVTPGGAAVPEWVIDYNNSPIVIAGVALNPSVNDGVDNSGQVFANTPTAGDIAMVFFRLRGAPTSAIVGLNLKTTATATTSNAVFKVSAACVAANTNHLEPPSDDGLFDGPNYSATQNITVTMPTTVSANEARENYAEITFTPIPSTCVSGAAMSFKLVRDGADAYPVDVKLNELYVKVQ
jgi:hypothetical protein